MWVADFGLRSTEIDWSRPASDFITCFRKVADTDWQTTDAKFNVSFRNVMSRPIAFRGRLHRRISSAKFFLALQKNVRAIWQRIFRHENLRTRIHSADLLTEFQTDGGPALFGSAHLDCWHGDSCGPRCYVQCKDWGINCYSTISDWRVLTQVHMDKQYIPSSLRVE